MHHFKHNDSGTVIINDYEMPLTEFLIEEPGYVKSVSCIAREYFVGMKDLGYTANYEQSVELGQEAELDGYIAKLATYKANIQARRATKADDDYALSLSTAKTVRKKQAKREAVTLYRQYEDTDLELTPTELNAYKADLIAQKNIIGPEIDALTTIRQVREYEYSNWPPIP